MARAACVTVALAVALLSPTGLHAQSPAFYGKLLRSTPYGLYPYPNLGVVLVHRQSGPSPRRYSDANGFYYFDRIPSCNDDYLMQVWSGNRTIYQKMVAVRGCPYAYPPIVLQ